MITCIIIAKPNNVINEIYLGGNLMSKFNKITASIVTLATVLLFTGLISYAAPVIQDFQKTGNMNEAVLFTESDFLDHYEDDAELVSIRFPELPITGGGLMLSDTEISANQEIPRNELDNIKFVPAEDFEGSLTIPWQASNGTEFSDSANIDIIISGEEPEESPSPSPSVEPSPSPTQSPEPPTFHYIDLDGHWVNDYAVELALKNILRGEQIGGNFYFEPAKMLNRGDFVLLLNAALGLTTSTPQNEDFDFIDKDTMPSWLYRQGKIAYEAGVIKGSEGPAGISFNPYGQLTRVEAITMLDNILDPINPVEPFDLTFDDTNTVPEWGVVPIGKMLAKNIVQGYDDNTIRPFEPILRESAAVLISGMLRNMPAPETMQRIMQTRMNNEEILK
jgi:hypothetical protein